jgi:hypothetical protein
MTDWPVGAGKSARKSISRKIHRSNQERPPMEIGEHLGLVVPAVSSRITEIWGF